MRMAMYLILGLVGISIVVFLWTPEPSNKGYNTPAKLVEANQLLAKVQVAWSEAKKHGDTEEVKRRRQELQEALEYKRDTYIECFPDETILPSTELKDD